MMRFIIITVSLLLILSAIAAGEGPKISAIGNKHNFSSSNTGVTFRAADGDPLGRQICIFCHTPHNAKPEGPLWNRNDPTGPFKRWSSATLDIDNIGGAAYGQPTGSSRLCLSCHDGVTAIGAVFSAPSPILMSNGKDKIGYETYSSHHPVSFSYNETVVGLLNGLGNNFRLPIPSDVKVDKDKRMQCTTCHDPHQDKSITPGVTHPFWVSADYVTVCTSCHDTSPAYPWVP